MPGDLAAAVDVHHRRAVEGAVQRLGTPARRVDRLVLQQQQRVRLAAVDDALVDAALLVPTLDVGHERRSEAKLDHAQLRHASRVDAADPGSIV